jgi:cell division protein FtsN
MERGVFALCCVLGLSLARASPALILGGPDGGAIEADRDADPDADADLLLLGVRIERELLDDVMPAYRRQGALLLPLSALVQLLELDIDVDLRRAVAAGTISGQPFRLDAADLRVKFGDSERPLTGAVERHADDLYVGLDLLELWLPAELVADERAALLTLWPRQPLPSRLRREREQRATFLGGGDHESVDAGARVAVPYRLFDAPFADLTMRATIGDAPGSNTMNHTALLSGDLLGLESLLFVSGTRSDPFAQARLSLGRRDPDHRLLGPLRASELVLGESFHPGIELVTAARSGPGILLSNFPLGYVSRFDQQSFVGELPPGWEVELYRGVELLAYRSSRADGRYEIRDVPLLFGTNRFRLVFYGPYGERREITETYEVGRSQTPPGRLRYRLSANDPETAAPRGHLELSYGIARSLSLSFSGAAIEVGGSEDAKESRGYYQAGLRGTLGRWFTTLDFAGDDAGGSAVQGRVQTRLGQLGLSLEQSFFSSYTSEAFPSPQGELESRTLLRLDGGVPMFGRRRLPLSLRLRHDRLAAGGSYSEIGARLSTSRRGLFVSNELQWSATDLGVARSERGDGRLLLSRYGSGLALRGELAYALAPAVEPTEVSLTAERRLARSFTLSLGARHSLATEETHYLVEGAKRKGAFGFGVLLDFSEGSGLRATASFSVGVAPDPFSQRWYTDAQPVAAMGALAVRAFLDTDADGVQDPGEPPLAGVGFTVDGVPRAERTDESGLLLLPRVPVHRETAVRVQPATLEDPLHVPAREALRLVPRIGRTAVLDFPVLSTGEITGTARFEENGDWRAASNLSLQLVDAGGGVIAETRTAYDGFYDFTLVPPGRYTLRLDPDQPVVTSTGLAGRTVEVPAGGAILDGVDLGIPVPSGGGEGEGLAVAVAEWAPAGTAEPATPLDPATRGESPVTRSSRRPVRDETIPAAVTSIPLALASGEPAPFAPLEPARPTPVRGAPGRGAAGRGGRALAFVSPDWQTRGASYGVQVGSFRERGRAIAAAAECARSLTMPCDVVQVELSSLGLWHRVVAGRLATSAEAWELRRRIDDGTIGSVVQVLPPPRPPAERAAGLAAGSDASARYSVQVASFQELAAARRLATELRRETAMDSTVVTVDLGEKGIWHRVLVGAFATRSEARALDRRLANVEGAGSGLVVRAASAQ